MLSKPDAWERWQDTQVTRSLFSAPTTVRARARDRSQRRRAAAAVAERLFGSGGRGLVLACTMLATLGVLAGDLLATPRSFIPVAEDGMLPASLASVHAKCRTPHVAIITYAAVSCALAVSGTFKPLAILASVSLLLIYLAVCPRR